MMIAERQNREKTIPKRRKKEKMIKAIAKDETTNEYDEDDDGDEDKDDDDSDYVDNVNNVKEAITETNEAVTVNIRFDANIHQMTNKLKSKKFHSIFVQREKELTNQLTSKLAEMESRLVRGGRNIVDTYNERQVELERKLEEIAERKKREVEMQQQLELQEETTYEIRETLQTVEQEVELKTRKLKKCYAKYMVRICIHCVIDSCMQKSIFI